MILGISTIVGQDSCSGVVDQHIMVSTVLCVDAFILLLFGDLGMCGFIFFHCFRGFIILVFY